MMSLATLQKEILAENPTESTMTDGVSLLIVSLPLHLSLRLLLWPLNTTVVLSSALMLALPM